MNTKGLRCNKVIPLLIIFTVTFTTNIYPSQIQTKNTLRVPFQLDQSRFQSAAEEILRQEVIKVIEASLNKGNMDITEAGIAFKNGELKGISTALISDRNVAAVIEMLKDPATYDLETLTEMLGSENDTESLQAFVVMQLRGDTEFATRREILIALGGAASVLLLGGTAAIISHIARKTGAIKAEKDAKRIEDEVSKDVNEVNKLIEDFKLSNTEAENLFLMREILNLKDRKEYALMLTILTELHLIPSYQKWFSDLRVQYEYYKKDYFFGKFLRVISRSPESKDNLSKLKSIINKMLSKESEIIKSIGISKLCAGLIRHALLISYAMEEDDKDDLFGSANILFVELIGSFRPAEPYLTKAVVTKDIVVDFLSNDFLPDSVKIDVINHVVELGITFGDKASISHIEEELERIYKQDTSSNVRVAAKSKLEQIEKAKGERVDREDEEGKETLTILKGSSVNREIVNPASVQGAAGVESAPNAHKLIYYKEGPNWGFVRFDFKKPQKLANSTLQIEVQGAPGKERIEEFGITLVHQGRGMRRLPVHIDDIDVSKDGVVNIDIPGEIKGVDLNKIERLLIHVAEMFDYEETKFKNSKGSEILVLSIKVVPKVEKSKGEGFLKGGAILGGLKAITEYL